MLSGLSPRITSRPTKASAAAEGLSSGSTVVEPSARFRLTTSAPLARSSRAGTRFMEGEPMKSATKMLAGVL